MEIEDSQINLLSSGIAFQSAGVGQAFVSGGMTDDQFAVG